MVDRRGWRPEAEAPESRCGHAVGMQARPADGGRPSTRADRELDRRRGPEPLQVAVGHKRQTTLAAAAHADLGPATDPAAVRAARGAVTAHQARTGSLSYPRSSSAQAPDLAADRPGPGGRGASLLPGRTTRELDRPAHSGVVTQERGRDVRRHAARREQFGCLEITRRQAP